MNYNQTEPKYPETISVQFQKIVPTKNSRRKTNPIELNSVLKYRHMREIIQLISGEKSVYHGYAVDHEPKVKDSKIADLIDQVEGIDRNQEPQTGFLQRFKRKEKIPLKTQLQAVRELGHSASQEALGFLNWLLSEPQSVETSVETSQLASWAGEYHLEVYYPNARGLLGEKLRLKTCSGKYNMLAGHTFSEPEEIERELNHQKTSLPAHMIINSAIQNLRKDLQLITKPTTSS